ncbi:hypothetical protein [Streptomyces sp. ACA25]|uniref:hypothetical protein n=1 Tax=Streptomyces sp. ACA25 TaxID=3022596 RepID=UPI002FE41CF4
MTVTVLPDSAAVPVPFRTWAGAWTDVPCTACGRTGQWPQPEFDCPCGTRARLTPGGILDFEEPPDGTGRGVFRPVTIRTAHDAVVCAAQFLRWLGHQQVRTVAPRASGGVDLRGPSVAGLVDPTTAPTGQREVETLWLHALSEGVLPVAFSLAGFDRQARARADELMVPLFVFDLAGTPQPVNDPADALYPDRT